jgi:predicted CopG family antitoxin
MKKVVGVYLTLEEIKKLEKIRRQSGEKSFSELIRKFIINYHKVNPLLKEMR